MGAQAARMVWDPIFDEIERKNIDHLCFDADGTMWDGFLQLKMDLDDQAIQDFAEERDWDALVDYFRRSWKRGCKIFIVTNNIGKNVERLTRFAFKYQEESLGHLAVLSSEGFSDEKVTRLERILKENKISKDRMAFADDSEAHVERVKEYGVLSFLAGCPMAPTMSPEQKVAKDKRRRRMQEATTERPTKRLKLQREMDESNSSEQSEDEGGEGGEEREGEGEEGEGKSVS